MKDRDQLSKAKTNLLRDHLRQVLEDDVEIGDGLDHLVDLLLPLLHVLRVLLQLDELLRVQPPVGRGGGGRVHERVQGGVVEVVKVQLGLLLPRAGA